MNKEKHMWTISIIAQYDKSVNSEYEELEYSILKQEYCKHLAFIIFKYDQETEEAFVRIRQKNLFGYQFFKTIKLGKVDIYSKKNNSLIKFFQEYVSSKKNAETKTINKKMLITWGHGAGIGFFYKEFEKAFNTIFQMDGVDTTAKRKVLNFTKKLQIYKAHLSLSDSKIDFDKLIDHYSEILGVTLDKQEWVKKIKKIIKVINAKELNDIIKEGLDKVDVLLTMNCYMQMFETCLPLQETVGLVISPQTTITFWGYNYFQLFKIIIESPKCTDKIISKNITSFYSSKYFDKELEPINGLNDVSISCIDLKRFNCVLENFEDIATYINSNLETEFETSIGTYQLKHYVELARRKCFSEYSAIIDFRHFLNQLSIYLYDDKNEFSKLINKHNEVRNEVLLSTYQPGRLHEPDFGTTYLSSIGPQFASIFFPYENYEELQFFNENFRYNEIMGSTSWASLLEKLNPTVKDYVK